MGGCLHHVKLLDLVMVSVYVLGLELMQELVRRCLPTCTHEIQKKVNVDLRMDEWMACRQVQVRLVVGELYLTQEHLFACHACVCVSRTMKVTADTAVSTLHTHMSSTSS
jgi:hypothetical protein